MKRRIFYEDLYFAKRLYGRRYIICVSEDINKIRTKICKDFNPNEDYPILNIWDKEV